MTQLTATQQLACAQYAGQQLFAGACATFNVGDIEATVAALDAAFDTTLNTAVSAGFGSDTVINALAAQIPAPFSGATVQQKTLVCCYVLMKRAGLI
jgi:hypothetical protein